MGFEIVQHLVSLPAHIRTILQRVGNFPAVLIAVAGVAILYSLVKRITLGLDTSIPNILLRDEVSDAVVIDPSCVPSLEKLVRRHDVYVIVRVDDDPMEDKVREAFKSSGIFQHGLNPLKIVFCETPLGRVSAVRQLEPHLHVDCDIVVISELQRFVRQLLCVNPDGANRLDGAPNVIYCPTLESFLAMQ